ncbi:AAEL014372-PA [Aedes aegypti]|uniref:AAEL014372-PA n=1 Tax=Aedes aegypti TaxID=7159 RepID=Q16GH9_AEDAE|nr:AAEL014372-PA [Aedes aegypti]
MQFDAQQDSAAAPNWLNDRFLQEVIRKAKNDGTITLYHSCKVRPGGRDGVQHASNLFRTTVHYRSKREPREQAIDLIMKIDRGMRSDAQFATEIRMYKEVLPAMEQVLKDVGETMDVPKYFFSTSDPRNLIVMEDLFPSGWIQKRELDSFDDAKLCIEAISKFHATSYALNKKSKQVSSILRGNVDIHKMVSTIDSLIESLCTRRGCSQIGSKLRSLKPQFQDKLKQIFSPANHDHFVSILNHGDIAVSNLWYRSHPDSKVAMIDFQNCHWGTPAIDLLSLLDLILDRKLRRSQSDRLIREYHRTLTSALARLGYRGAPFSLQELVKELRSCVVLELLHLAMRNQQRGDRHVDENRVDREADDELQQDLSELMRRGILD